VRAAVRAHGARLHSVLLEREDAPRLAALARFARDQGVPNVDIVGRALLDRLAGPVQHQGVAAWAPELELIEFEPLLDDPALLGLVLDRVQDPHNFGAVLRSTVGLGASAVIWGEHASAPLGPGTLRAAAGAAEFAKLCRVGSLPRALTDARARGAAVIGLDAQAEAPLASIDLRGPTLIVVGSEHEGMTPAVRRACNTFGRLVEPNSVESLNASVAAAIALYEAKRQRNSVG
jgi:23S rRNA (guanosine2251-2'-O)-methyltransferase